MQKQKGITTLVGIIIIIAVAIIVFGGVFAYQYWVKKSVPAINQTSCVPEGGSYGAPLTSADLCCSGLVEQPTSQSGTSGVCVKPTDQTAGWKTYTNEGGGYEFKYPEIIKDYIVDQQWPPEVTIDSNTSDYSCPSMNKFPNGYGEQKEIIISNDKYCFWRADSAAAGTAYSDYSYKTIKNDKLLTFAFTLGFPECSNYSDPQAVTECNKEQSDISSQLNQLVYEMVSTFKFTTPENQSTNQESPTTPTANGPFSSPTKGEIFVFGDTIPVKWDPTLIDASTIYMVCADSTICSSNYEIYGRQDINDPVSKNGSFSYTATSYTGPGPGKYKIMIYSYGQKSSIESEEFTIAPAPGAASPTKNPFYIQTFYGQKSVYSPGELIDISVDARDWDEAYASPNLGFNIQAHIFDANNYAEGAYQAVNASYDYTNNLWQIHITAPLDKTIIYNLQISLYCGSASLNSVCAQEHGNSNQTEKSISFTVQ